MKSMPIWPRVQPLAQSAAEWVWAIRYALTTWLIARIAASVNLSPDALPPPQRIDMPVRLDLYYGGMRDSNGFNLISFPGGRTVAALSFRYLRLSLALYTPALVLFTAFAAFSDMPLLPLLRYLLPVFPLFLALAIWGQNARVDRVLSYLGAALLGVFTVRFATRYRVA